MLQYVLPYVHVAFLYPTNKMNGSNASLYTFFLLCALSLLRLNRDRDPKVTQRSRCPTAPSAEAQLDTAIAKTTHTCLSRSVCFTSQRPVASISSLPVFLFSRNAQSPCHYRLSISSSIPDHSPKALSSLSR